VVSERYNDPLPDGRSRTGTAPLGDSQGVSCPKKSTPSSLGPGAAAPDGLAAPAPREREGRRNTERIGPVSDEGVGNRALDRARPCAGKERKYSQPRERQQAKHFALPSFAHRGSSFSSGARGRRIRSVRHVQSMSVPARLLLR
jgi:hypothetical protein